MKWLMFIVNLLPSTVFASATIQEQIAASNNTIMVATLTANVGIATNAPSIGVSLDVAGAAQFGQGVNKSTFNASVSGTSYALQTASGVKVGGGGPVQFQDGTLQYTAAVAGPTLAGNNSWTGRNTFTGGVVSANRANVFLNTGDQNITSADFVGVTGSTLTLTIQATNPAIYTCTIRYFLNGAGIVSFEALIDGAQYNTPNLENTIEQVIGTSGSFFTSSFVMITPGLLAGVHNFTLMAAASANTLTIGKSNLRPLVCVVWELH